MGNIVFCLPVAQHSQGWLPPLADAAAWTLCLTLAAAACLLGYFLRTLTSKRAERLKLAEQALSFERFLLATLMQYSPDHIYFKDRQSRFLRISRAQAEKFGLGDPDEAIGKTDADFFDPEHAAAALDDERRVIREGRPIVNKEEREIWPDGRVSWCSTTKVPLRNEKGEIVGTFGISRDVTARKQAEERLHEAKQAAELANRAKSVFLASMSHEIRTPMNAILGMTELVLETKLTNEQREYLSVVAESGEALLGVINDILDFSKIEAGKLVLDEAPFDLAETLGDTMKSLAMRAHRQGLELAYYQHGDVPGVVVGDRARLRQIVVNLVGNAVKFTDSGEIVLEVRRAESDDGHLLLEFSVRDTGIGIPEDKLEAIFAAFEQVDGPQSHRRGGTGLGLAISARLTDLMGGQIWVESTTGQGSTFHFTARFRTADAETAAADATWQAVVRGTRVLVVDDNATNRRILEEMLGNWGMNPTTAGGAEEALRLLAEAQMAAEPYRLVLTDANMPELDGFDLAGRIMHDNRLSGTVIMMLTSGDCPGDVARCDALGVTTYLLKPVKQSELLEAVMLALGVTMVEDAANVPEMKRESRLAPLRVLVAEDSLVNQKVAVGLLKKWGHTPVIANNGREATGAMETQDFDLVLMDVQMPEMDGLEATRTIRARQQRSGRHTPIIAMTAHAMKGDRQQCLDAGMDDYVAKPISAARLLETIERLLARSREEGTSCRGQVTGDGGKETDDGKQEGWLFTAESPVDWSEALRAVQGDEVLLKDVVKTFLEESDALLATMRRAIADKDARSLRRAAHTLKGSLRYVGASAVFETAFSLEKMAQADDFDAAAKTLVSLEQGLARLAPVLVDYVDS